MNNRDRYINNADNFLTEEPIEYDDKKIAEITEQAANAFWEKVGQLVTEAKFNEIDPLVIQTMENDLKKHVKRWIETNV